jgi:hypothetical protein
MNKYLHWLSAITLITALSLMFYFSYLLFWPFKILDQLGDFQTVKRTYKQGEIFYYKTSYCKYSQIPATVVRKFIDGMVFTLPTISTNNVIGCHTITSGLTIIPTNLPAGKYYYTCTLIFKVNPFREINYEIKSNAFEVIE